jgi:transcriptional repressor NrdR
MYCPSCQGENLRVLEKRDTEGEIAIRRRRECVSCGYRFTTYERLEVPSLVVVKKDGHKEVYSRDKMSVGIYKACEKRPIEEPEIEAMVDDIEKELKGCSENEVASSKIGNLVMKKLLAADEVAYLRFASVYKSFKDVNSFVKELEGIKTSEN